MRDVRVGVSSAFKIARNWLRVIFVSYICYIPLWLRITSDYASNLVKRLFPGLGNKELSKDRKLLVKQYTVVRYYPEHRDETSFKNSIVPKVNELLRRKEKRKENENELDTVPPSPLS